MLLFREWKVTKIYGINRGSYKMKEYKIKKIKSPMEIESCVKAEITEAQWNCRMQPKSWAYMGYQEGKGLLVRMACEETNPHRVHVYHKGPVWTDSALELFLAFPIHEGGVPGEIDGRCLYLNFELNANAAMYAQYGYGKENREFIPDQVYRESRCNAVIGRDGWRVDFLIPEWYLGELTGRKLEEWLAAGDGEGRMRCNFYKISESPEIEHYMSYSRIESDVPDFHLPSCFAEVGFER